MVTTVVGVGNDVNDKSKSENIVCVEDFKNENPYTDEQREALRQKALSDGYIIDNLIVNKSRQLVWGYVEFEIAKEHHLPYEVKNIDLETKADCLAWISEKKLTIPCLNTFKKIELGYQWYEYWMGKDEAKNGEKSLLKQAAQERYGRADKSAIIAIKVGTSHNTVNKAKNILDSDNKELIEQCRAGDTTIGKAYELINSSNDNVESNEKPEVPVEKALKADKDKRLKVRNKEIHALAKYCVDGFTTKKVKLDENGLNYFILRWNDEHPENKIKDKDVQDAIDGYGKNEK